MRGGCFLGSTLFYDNCLFNNIPLQLRYLQTLNRISAENNSTIIFPVPVDILRCIMNRYRQEQHAGNEDKTLTVQCKLYFTLYIVNKSDYNYMPIRNFQFRLIFQTIISVSCNHCQFILNATLYIPPYECYPRSLAQELLTHIIHRLLNN